MTQETSVSETGVLTWPCGDQMRLEYEQRRAHEDGRSVADACVGEKDRGKTAAYECHWRTLRL